MTIQTAPNLPDTLPRQQATIIIQGFTFQLVMPYAEGHVLSDIEAGVLNREWTQGVRSNFTQRVQEVIADANSEHRPLDNLVIAKLQVELQHYADDYSFKALLQRQNADPVVREAYKIAKGLLDTRLNSMNITRESYGEARYEQALSKIMNNPEVVREANQRVALTRDAANSLIGLEN